MPRAGKTSAVVTLRVPPALHRSIEREARRSHRTPSAVVREVLEGAFGGQPPSGAPEDEARRQSLLVSTRVSERQTLRFIEQAADDRGWR